MAKEQLPTDPPPRALLSRIPSTAADTATANSILGKPLTTNVSAPAAQEDQLSELKKVNVNTKQPRFKPRAPQNIIVIIFLTHEDPTKKILDPSQPRNWQVCRRYIAAQSIFMQKVLTQAGRDGLNDATQKFMYLPDSTLKLKSKIKSKVVLYLKYLIEYAKSQPPLSNLDHIDLTDIKLIQLIDIWTSWMSKTPFVDAITLEIENNLRYLSNLLGFTESFMKAVNEAADVFSVEECKQSDPRCCVESVLRRNATRRRAAEAEARKSMGNEARFWILRQNSENPDIPMIQQENCVWLHETWVLRYCSEFRVAIEKSKISDPTILEPDNQCYLYDRDHPDWKKKRITGVGAYDRILYWDLFIQYHPFSPGIMSKPLGWVLEDRKLKFDCVVTLFRWQTQRERFGPLHEPAPSAINIASLLGLQDVSVGVDYWWDADKAEALEKELPWSSTFYFLELAEHSNIYPDRCAKHLELILARNDAEEAQIKAKLISETQGNLADSEIGRVAEKVDGKDVLSADGSDHDGDDGGTEKVPKQRGGGESTAVDPSQEQGEKQPGDKARRKSGATDSLDFEKSGAKRPLAGDGKSTTEGHRVKKTKVDVAGVPAVQ